MHRSHITTYGQLLGQLLVFSCQPFDDLLQGQLELPAVVRKGLQPYPANTANDSHHRARTHGQNLDSTEITALKNHPNLESQDTISVLFIFEGFAMLFSGEQANIVRQ